MDNRLLVIPAILLGCAAIWQYGLRAIPAEPDSELTIYSSQEDCKSDGQSEETCARLWQAAQKRANQTASLYTTLPKCEERYGQGNCRKESGPISEYTTVSYFAPRTNGVALAVDLVPKGIQIIAFEPVYPCPQNWKDKPVCFQSVRGPIYTEYGKHRLSNYSDFDKTFRNPMRERIGEKSDDNIGYRLITEEYELVSYPSQSMIEKSKRVVPGFPRSPERRNPKQSQSVFETTDP